MKKQHRRRGTLVLALFSIVLFLGTAHGRDIETLNVRNDFQPGSNNQKIENVFLVIIDGLRNIDAFKDPTHQFIPRIWNDLRPLGTMYMNFYNLGRTDTTPSHYAMATGVTQMVPNKNMHQTPFNIIQEEPSIFQYYRHQLGTSKDKTWILNGKGGMIGKMGESLNPFYSNSYSPHVAIGFGATDEEILDEFMKCVDDHHPSLTVVNLADVDCYGHSGDWILYTQAIMKADAIVFEMCQRIWRNPHYKDNTAIIITSDHGRHLDNICQGFSVHGCSCPGCRDVPFLAIGPDIKKNTVITRPGFLRDIAPTIAWMLGFSADFGMGRILGEMFVTPPPAKTATWQTPSIACVEEKLHVVATCRDTVGTSHIFYKNTQNNGQTWSEEICLSYPSQFPQQDMLENSFPTIIAEGKRVSVVWSSIQNDGRMSVLVRESFDGGSSWQNPVHLKCSSPLWADFYPDACYQKGVLNVAWTDTRYDEVDLYLARVQGSTIIDFDTLTQEYALYPRCEPSQNGIHIVFQKLSDKNHNWNIAYCRYDGSEWCDSVFLTETADHSLRPDIAADSSGIHVVWAERSNGAFKITIMNSQDGNTWDDPLVIGESLIGAWRPRISAANGFIAVVWEGYESSEPTVFYSFSADNGLSWTSPVKVFQSSAFSTSPAMLLDSKNLMHVISTVGSWPMELEYTNIRL